jgi:hypothetical protein
MRAWRGSSDGCGDVDGMVAGLDATGESMQPLMLLSPLGERLGEGVMEETVFGLTPLPNLSPKGERNMSAGGFPPLASFPTLIGGSLAEIAGIGSCSSKGRNDALSACRRARGLACCRSHAPLLESFRGYKEGISK